MLIVNKPLLNVIVNKPLFFYFSIFVRFVSVLDTAGQEGFSAMREQVLVFNIVIFCVFS